ncbi:MAG TPA: L,D-transpeptidase [Gaiellaceae bacterium]|nr:L,D-transpeptidase [Gaiellaceae bacterium]
MKRLGSVLCLTLVCVLGAGAATVRADDATIASGVSIGPVQVGGLTLEQATEAVLQSYLAPLTLKVGSEKVTVSPTRFHTVAPVAAAVAQALAAAPGAAIPLKASVDMSRVAAYVQALAKRFDTKPVVGRLLVVRWRPAFAKSKPGQAIQLLATRILIRNAIRDAVRAPITVPTRRIAPNAAQLQVGPVIVIKRASNRLTLFDGTKLVRAFKVATGQPQYPTPLGRFQIVVKWKNPTWYPPTQDAWAKGLKPVPPGPDNPLGTRWMGLSVPGVGIHGTDEPASIGYSLSHGCIRMQVPDAEWLFDHVTVGTPVFIVDK